ncbi:nicolin-1 [Ambystoma mexicanum]|uniref:nicolin-1 n=1 Tax=Ambystoma mexicanum TaxID=8296 RepID=UPI0037E9A2FF
MSQEPVVCNIKASVPLQVGDMKTDLGHPGVAVIDVTFPQVKHIDLQAIQFKNYYTAFLTVRIQQRRPSEAGEGPLKWRTCLKNYCLMPNPHTEEGSQDYVSLYRHQMLGDVNRVSSVRFVLRQPSPVWLQFNLEELQINPCVEMSPQKGFPTWLSHPSAQEPPSNLHHELPDPDRVSTEVQQMWVLTEMIRANQTSARIGRFDVDGCYDINLLSYT